MASNDNSSKKIKHNTSKNDEDDSPEKVDHRCTKKVKHNTPQKSKGNTAEKLNSASANMVQNNTPQNVDDDIPEKVNFRGSTFKDPGQLAIMKSVVNEFVQLANTYDAKDELDEARAKPEATTEIEEKDGVWKFQVAKCFATGHTTNEIEKEKTEEKEAEKKKR